jgi:peroxiredoxin family protein
MTNNITKQIKENEARELLLKNFIKKDTTILIVIKSTSQSGMSRRMKVLVNNLDITSLISELCDLSQNDKGLKIIGCGMDMTFWLANHITIKLWPNKKDRPFGGNGNQPCIKYTYC